MNAINASLAIRNNVLIFAGEWPDRFFTVRNFLDSRHMPEGVNNPMESASHQLIELAKQGVLVREKIKDYVFPGPKYRYRLREEGDPAASPSPVRQWKPAKDKRTNQPRRTTAKLQREANALAEQIRKQHAERNDPRAQAINPNASAPVMQAMTDNYMSDRDKAYAKRGYETHNLRYPPLFGVAKDAIDKRVAALSGEANTLPDGIKIDVTPAGLTVSLGKITLTIKAE